MKRHTKNWIIVGIIMTFFFVGVITSAYWIAKKILIWVS